MDRDTILTALKDDISTYIQSSNTNYTSDIGEVRRGIHGHTEIVNRPFIGISMESDDVDQEIFEDTGTDQIRIITIYIYSYSNTDGIDDYTTMYDLIKDLEYCLKYDFTYKSKTYIGKIGIVEGGVSNPLAFFDMYITIQYQIDT